MRKKASQSLIWVLTAVVCLSSSLKPAEAAEATDQTSEEIQRWKDPLHDHEKSRGLGVSLDQAFNPRFTGFLRAGLQDKSVSQVDLAVSLGFEWSGPLTGRDKDVLALAVGLASLSEDYEDAAPMDTGNEQMAEVYYTFYVNDHLRISPDIQVIRNPAGLAGADTVTILGVRAQVLF
ncbi:MAG: carbohydrate porin [bacterium]